MYETLLVNL